MAEQMTFKRYEIKYAMDRETMETVVARMSDHMAPDPHGHSQIQSLYFDTPDYLLARRSMEHPMYKEKLRLRSYGVADENTPVFLELKKKFDSVVYKRRITMTEDAMADYLMSTENRRENLKKSEQRQFLRTVARSSQFSVTDHQILKEIDYSFERYEDLEPRMLLMYDRDAFYDRNDHEFRITFDSEVLWRNKDLDLKSGIYGERVCPEDKFLMEVKAGGAIPIWFVQILTDLELYKTSFSKYGTAYQIYSERVRENAKGRVHVLEPDEWRDAPIAARA